MVGELLGAEDPVAGIAQTGDDIGVIVQLFVHGSQIHIHVRMSFLHSLAALGAERVVITGIPVIKGEKTTVTTAALDLSPTSLDRAPFYVSLPRLDARYHGTGELFASVLLGRLLNGYGFSATVSAASAFVRDVIDYSSIFDTPFREGIALEPCLRKLMK